MLFCLQGWEIEELVTMVVVVVKGYSFELYLTMMKMMIEDIA